MSLRDLALKEDYRSDCDNLVQDFYIPCLEQSRFYDRAVGFFSSTSLAVIARGLTTFVQSGGKMRLVASPQLSHEDIAAIAKGLAQREQVIEQALVRELEQDFEQVVRDRLACLAWLLAQGQLEIQLAVSKDLKRHGIYHEKLGVFRDGEGNLAAFTGSANETSSALTGNFECLDVFPSWVEGVRERAHRKAQNFEDLWGNGTPNVEVMAFPEAAQRSLLKLKPNQQPSREPRVATPQKSYKSHHEYKVPEQLGIPALPDWIELRDYQALAVSNWFKNQGRGTLKMATGSGKTITALAIAAQAYMKMGLKALIIVCPYRHLVSQWAKECEKFGLQPILAFESVRKWQGQLVSDLYHLRAGHQVFLTVVTTNTTLMSTGFSHN